MRCKHKATVKYSDSALVRCELALRESETPIRGEASECLSAKMKSCFPSLEFHPCLAKANLSNNKTFSGAVSI